MAENLNEHISPVEARRIIEVVTGMAKDLMFTHLDAMKIAKICTDRIDALEKESFESEE